MNAGAALTIPNQKGDLMRLAAPLSIPVVLLTAQGLERRGIHVKTRPTPLFPTSMLKATVQPELLRVPLRRTKWHGVNGLYKHETIA